MKMNRKTDQFCAGTSRSLRPPPCGALSEQARAHLVRVQLVEAGAQALRALRAEEGRPAALEPPGLSVLLAVVFIGVVHTRKLSFVNFHPTVAECQNTFVN